MRIALILASFVAVGCAGAATPAATSAGPTSACARDFSWLEGANQVRVELARSGHGGLWTVYVRLFAEGDSFEGVAMAAFQRRPDEPAAAKARAVTMTRAQVTPLLRLLRESFEARPETSTAPQRFVSSTDRIEWRTVDVAKSDPHAPAHHAQLYTDATDVVGPEWFLRGCVRPSHASADLRARTVGAYDAFLAATGATALVDALQAEAKP